MFPSWVYLISSIHGVESEKYYVECNNLMQCDIYTARDNIIQLLTFVEVNIKIDKPKKETYLKKKIKNIFS
jgi:hypothetical protein